MHQDYDEEDLRFPVGWWMLPFIFVGLCLWALIFWGVRAVLL